LSCCIRTRLVRVQFELADLAPGLFEAFGPLDGDGGERSQRADQPDLVGAEVADRARRSVEHADGLVPPAHRHGHDRVQPFGPDHLVDAAVVGEAVVVEVVRRPQRCPDLQALVSEAVPGGDLLPGDERGGRAVRGPHAKAALRVEEGDRCHVEVEQPLDPPGDHAQQGVQVMRGRQVPGGVDQVGQAVLAPAPPALPVVHVPGQMHGLLQAGQVRLRSAVAPRAL
jgi:hypothetical protein